MKKYASPRMRELAAELSYAPVQVRSRCIGSAELLLLEISPDREYSYGGIHKRVTGFAPSIAPDEPIHGKKLLADLARLIADASFVLRENAAAQGEPILTLAEACTRSSVCERTLRRWRGLGLPARWFVLRDSELRLGIRQSALERFVEFHSELVARSARFTRLSEWERSQLIELARAIRNETDEGITSVAKTAAAQVGRSAETARRAIRQYDAQHPDARVFPAQRPRLSAQQMQEVFEQSRVRGTRVSELCARYARSRSAVYAAIHAVELKRILAERVRYVHSTEFEHPEAERRILGAEGLSRACATALRVETAIAPSRPPDVVSGGLRRAGAEPASPGNDGETYAAVAQTPLLSPQRERELFRGYNYLKYRMAKAQETLRSQGFRAEAVRTFQRTQQQVSSLRNELISSNLRLLASIARRHVGPLVGFSDLMSTGTIALMRAVESFDYTRGHKFSTYATWAVVKEYARTVPEENYRLATFVTGVQSVIEAAGRTDEERQRRETFAHLRHLVGKAIAALSAVEREVICARFGLNRPRSMTLDEIGHLHSLTGERIRQIQNVALERLRRLLGEEAAEALPG